MFKCKHCSQKINALDDVPSHYCFIGKSVYIENDNTLFTVEEDQSAPCSNKETTSKTSCSTATPCSSETSAPNEGPEDEAAKPPAVWDRKATLGLLSLYEANMEMLDHPKKKTKIWEAISNGLINLGIKMTTDQVRWKMNALIKKYKEVVDNNSKSGRGVMEFQWFDQMDDIFGTRTNAAKRHTVSSKFPSTATSASTELEKKRHHEPSELASTSGCNSNVLNNNTDSNKRRRALHGTGSNIAKTKVELEKKWLQYLRNKEEHDRVKDNKYASSNECKKEALKLKKKQLTLKEAELEQRKEISINKAKDKLNRHAELIKIEKQKIKLIKKLLDNDKEIKKNVIRQNQTDSC